LIFFNKKKGQTDGCVQDHLNGTKIVRTILLGLALLFSMPIRVNASGLEAALKKYRAEQAYVKAVPAMNVFGDKVLRGIVSAKPTTLKRLQEIKGIGARRREMYGADIVRLVNMAKRKGPVRPARSEPKTVSRFFQAPAKPAEPKPMPPIRQRSRRELLAGQSASVYILELEQGRVYVGSSRDVKRRVEQHVAGTGSAYTRVYKPTGVLLPRLGNVGGDGDAAERDETLRYMMLRGIPYVRGWKFAQVVMPPAEFDEAEANIRELFNLCRRCGYQGHFMTQCKANFDRCGTDLRK